MDRRFTVLATIAIGALGVVGSTATRPRAQSSPPEPRPRVLLTVGQLVSLTASCPFAGADTLSLANARRSASDQIRWRIGGGPWQHRQLDPGHRLVLSVPAARQTRRFRAHTLTPPIALRIEQPREPHTITATVRLRIGLDPSNGHRPECSLVDARLSATTAFHG